MLEKSGGFAALLDRGVVTQCSLCDTDNPDLENRGYCSACGAVFREKMGRRLLIVKGAVAVGVTLTLLGAAATLAMDSRWAGIAVFVLGIFPLGFGVLANRQLAGFLLQALALRMTPDAQRSLRTSNRVACGLLLYFLATFVGCIPLYLYVERPRHELGAYQRRFADKLNEYSSLVADDAVPGKGAKPYLAGKAVVLEKSAAGPRVSEVHLALPSDARAESPEDVGTVVLVEWIDVREGKYGNTEILAFRVDGDVRLINLSTRTLLARETFAGGKPPDQAPRDGSPGRGPKPIAKIAGYVGGLSRIAAIAETQTLISSPPTSEAKSKEN